jgi:hypothetical protein
MSALFREYFKLGILSAVPNGAPSAALKPREPLATDGELASQPSTASRRRCPVGVLYYIAGSGLDHTGIRGGSITHTCFELLDTPRLYCVCNPVNHF